MRLDPREADMAALAFMGKGRCFWPGCIVKICALVDGKYQFDCIRAHIEAAEKNGPRWNAAMSDEQRRAPDNLMWLCKKHHDAADANEMKYTVSVLKDWKRQRELLDPAQQIIDGLTESRLKELLDTALGRLVDELYDLNLPGLEIAEMLLRASESLPNAEVAEMLLSASRRLPSGDTAEMLFVAGNRLPSEDIAEMLHSAGNRLPSADTAAMLLEASKSFPDRAHLVDLRRTVEEFSKAADVVRDAVTDAASITIHVEDPKGTAYPWRWFAGGVFAALIILCIGVALGIYFTS